MSDQHKPLFTANIDQNATISPQSIDDLIDIASQEVEFWKWLRGGEVHSVGLATVDKQVLRTWERVHQHAVNWKQAPDQIEHRQQVMSHLATIKDARVPSRRTEDGQIINQIRQSLGTVPAAGAILFAMGREIDLAKGDQLRGAVAYCSVKMGGSALTGTAGTALIEQFSRDGSKLIEQMTADRAASTESAARQRDEERAEAVATIAAMRIELEGVRADNQALVSKLKTEFEEFKKFYKDGISLQGPVGYWDKKRSRHRSYAAIALVVFLAYLLLATLIVNSFIRETALGSIAFWKVAGYGLLVMVGVGAGILIALGRILVRLFMSQLHLGNDSDERVTMVQTYLALREGGHADAAHLEIVLTRLFTPTADGIVRDDVGPITPTEILAARLSGKT